MVIVAQEKRAPPHDLPSPRSRLAVGAAAQLYLRQQVSDKLAAIVEKYVALKDGPTAEYRFSKGFTTELRQHMLASYLAGLRAQSVDISRGKDMTPMQSREFLQLYDKQQSYFARFHVQMMDKKRKDVPLGPREIARARLYGTGTNDAFNRAKVTALVEQKDIDPSGVMISWHLSPAEHCFSDQTSILLPDNVIKKIGYIYGHSEISEILTYNHETGLAEPSVITKRFRRRYTGDLIRIHAVGDDRHRNLNMTPEHPIFVIGRGYIEARDLIVGDVLQGQEREERFYVCELCGEQLLHRQLGGHAVGHKTVACNICGELVRSKHGLWMHRRQHGKTYTCFCGYMTMNPAAYRGHQAAHSNKRGTVHCPICGKIYKGRQALSRHLTCHNRPDIAERSRLVSQSNMRIASSVANADPLIKLRGTMTYSKRIYAGLYNPAKHWLNRHNPTSLEQWLIDLKIPGVEFTGNGQRWFRINGKNANPDFCVAGQAKVIELGNTGYWHKQDDIEARVRGFTEKGIRCMFLSVGQIAANPTMAEMRIHQFVVNHDLTITDIKRIPVESIWVYNLETEDNHNYFANRLLVHNCSESPGKYGCLEMAAGSPYRLDVLTQRPGDGMSTCDGNCKCYLVFRKASKEKFNPAHDELGRFAESDQLSTEMLSSEDLEGANGFIYRNDIDLYDVGVRGHAKSRIVMEISSRMMKDPLARKALVDAGEDRVLHLEVMEEIAMETAVNSRIKKWSDTAGDQDPRALAMQLAVKEEFGLKNADPFIRIERPDPFSVGIVTDTKTYYKKHGDLDRRFLRAMYEHTQDELKKAGIEKVELYRGMEVSGDKLPSEIEMAVRGDPGSREFTVAPVLRRSGDANIKAQPVSAWSSEASIAMQFATLTDERNSIVVRAVVPASRILGTARTGFGCLSEREWVVLDTPGKVHVTVDQRVER